MLHLPRRVLNELRYQIGKRMFYYGFRMQPVRIRRGISFMNAIGYEWAKNNDADLTKVMNGEDLEEHQIAFTIGVPRAPE